MAQRWLIIDGYNLLHAAGLMRPRMGPAGLERARRTLAGRLERALNEQALRNTTIVFDGQGPATTAAETGGGSQLLDSSLTIQFSAASSDADTEIEQLLAHHSSPSQVVVVSSDHRLHKAAARRNAVCVDSEEFLDSLQESAEPGGLAGGLRRYGRAQRSEQPDTKEQQLLEAEFLEIDPQQLEAEERERTRRERSRGLHKRRDD